MHKYIRKTGQKAPGPFLAREYPIVYIPDHVPLYNTQ
ncbi:hypothetical protein EV207_1031, partial [Scopulibacillus darangshiensis]